MSKVTLDETLRAKLNGLQNRMEVCDEAGQTLGYFLTVEDYKQFVYAWAKLTYPLEKLERIAAEPGERTTAEVLARLAQR